MATPKADSKKRRRESMVLGARDRGRARVGVSQITLPCGKDIEQPRETGKSTAVYLIGLSGPLNRG
jgi:hypothetical protein